MPDNQRLNYLLHVYILNQITPAEAEELRLMIKSGDYDEEIKDIIDAELFLETGEQDVSPARAQALLDKIFAAEAQAEAILPVTRPLHRHRWWLAAAGTLIVVGTVWFWGHRRPAEAPIASHTAESTKKGTIAPAQHPGGRFVRLPDGSTVLLNGDSRLEYGKDYGIATREVALTGEGYFDVKHDTRHPFIVHTGKVRTTVLATAFNIKAYKGQENIKVTVTRGRVRVETGRQMLGTLTSNEQMAVNTTTNVFHLSRVDADTETQWKKQFLILEDISLADAAILISDRYHIHILFANESIRRCRISATFSNDETLEQVLTVICGVTGSEYTLQPNDQVVINGNGCD